MVLFGNDDQLATEPMNSHFFAFKRIARAKSIVFVDEDRVTPGRHELRLVGKSPAVLFGAIVSRERFLLSK